MSQFIGQPSADGPLRCNDLTLVSGSYDDDEFRWVTIDEVWALDGFRSPWWPRAGQLDASGGEWCQGVWCDRIEIVAGAIARFGVVGVTRDVYGTPLAGVTVKLFKTADGSWPGTRDTKLDETTSDGTGAYVLGTPYYPDTHYVVAYKSGTPDVEGTTVNTLIGA